MCVIQPVLSWYGDGSYDSWVMESWICCVKTSTGCFKSDTIKVNPGDVINGTLALENGNSWPAIRPLANVETPRRYLWRPANR